MKTLKEIQEEQKALLNGSNAAETKIEGKEETRTERLENGKKINFRFKKLGLIAGLILTIGLGTALAAGHNNNNSDKQDAKASSQEQVKADEIQVVPSTPEPAPEAQTQPVDQTQTPTQQQAQPITKIETVTVEKPVPVYKTVTLPPVSTKSTKATSSSSKETTTGSKATSASTSTNSKSSSTETKPSGTTGGTSTSGSGTTTTPTTTPAPTQTASVPATLTLLDRTEVFDKASGKKLSSIDAQTVNVKSVSDGWYEIQSWLGNVWIHPDKYVTNSFKLVLLNREKLYSAKEGSEKGQSIAPQTVTSIKRDGTWFLISTYDGDVWVHPQAFTITQN